MTFLGTAGEDSGADVGTNLIDGHSSTPQMSQMVTWVPTSAPT